MIQIKTINTNDVINTISLHGVIRLIRVMRLPPKLFQASYRKIIFWFPHCLMCIFSAIEDCNDM
jgi:hypothetical protein